MRSGFLSSRSRLSSDRSAGARSKCSTRAARQASRVAGVAQRVELERDPVGSCRARRAAAPAIAISSTSAAGLRRADDLGVELVELAEAALLRALVAEDGAPGGDLHRHVLLPAVGDEGAADAGGEFGAQGQASRRRDRGTCTSPWRRRRWSRRASGRTLRSPRTPAPRYAGRRRAGARDRTRRPPRGSGRPPRRSCPGCPGPFADPCSSPGH